MREADGNTIRFVAFRGRRFEFGVSSFEFQTAQSFSLLVPQSLNLPPPPGFTAQT